MLIANALPSSDGLVGVEPRGRAHALDDAPEQARRARAREKRSLLSATSVATTPDQRERARARAPARRGGGSAPRRRRRSRRRRRRRASKKSTQRREPDHLLGHDRGREPRARARVLERERDALGHVARDAPGRTWPKKTPIQVYLTRCRSRGPARGSPSAMRRARSRRARASTRAATSAGRPSTGCRAPSSTSPSRARARAAPSDSAILAPRIASAAALPLMPCGRPSRCSRSAPSRDRAHEREAEAAGTPTRSRAIVAVLVRVAADPVDHVVEEVHPAFHRAGVLAGDRELREPDHRVERGHHARAAASAASARRSP